MIYRSNLRKICAACEPYPALTDEEYDAGHGDERQRSGIKAARTEERERELVAAYQRATPEQQAAIRESLQKHIDICARALNRSEDHAT